MDEMTIQEKSPVNVTAKVKKLEQLLLEMEKNGDVRERTYI